MQIQINVSQCKDYFHIASCRWKTIQLSQGPYTDGAEAHILCWLTSRAGWLLTLSSIVGYCTNRDDHQLSSCVSCQQFLACWIGSDLWGAEDKQQVKLNIHIWSDFISTRDIIRNPESLILSVHKSQCERGRSWHLFNVTLSRLFHLQPLLHVLLFCSRWELMSSKKNRGSPWNDKHHASGTAELSGSGPSNCKTDSPWYLPSYIRERYSEFSHHHSWQNMSHRNTCKVLFRIKLKLSYFVRWICSWVHLSWIIGMTYFGQQKTLNCPVLWAFMLRFSTASSSRFTCAAILIFILHM